MNYNMTITTSPVITIDGPSGVGKSTLSKFLKKKLHWNLLDSGTIYRVIALFTVINKIDINNTTSLLSLLNNIKTNYKIVNNSIGMKINKKGTILNIYNEDIGNVASKIATLSCIRESLLEYQRSFLINPGLIAEGRDMGITVFPNAEVKIFLYASLEKRIYRRVHQLQKVGFNVNVEEIMLKMKERDIRDRNRKISPLIPAIDAFMIDSTNLNTDEVINISLKHIKKKLTFNYKFL